MNQLLVQLPKIDTTYTYSSIVTDRYVVQNKFNFKDNAQCCGFNNFYFYTNDDSTVELSRKYNLLSMYSFIIQYDSLIDTQKMLEYSLAANIDCFLNSLSNSDVDEIKHNYFAVIEHGSIKGYHINYCVLTTQPLNTSQIDIFFKALSLDEITLKYENIKMTISPIVKHQAIKSPGSWLNYLTKKPVVILSNKIEILQMVTNFKASHVFPNNSKSRSYKRTIDGDLIHSTNEMVQFFYRCFDEGLIDKHQILKVTDSQRFFHLQNFDRTYQTCHNAYLSRRTLTHELLYILQQYNDLSKENKCFCPINDWLDWQELDTDDVMKKFENWLFGVFKRNVLYFIGPANCGKSHIARLIWSCFLSHKIILQDGIFSFANLQNAGVALWEEPLVLPDFIDTVKLIFEGEANTEVAVKNQASLKLGKRIPIIVTTNKEITTYCSNQQEFVEARLFRFTCRNSISTDNFCKNRNTEHYCPLITDHTESIQSNCTLDGANSANQRDSDDESSQSEGWRKENRSQELSHGTLEEQRYDEAISECYKHIHYSSKNHMLTFLAYIIIKRLKSIDSSYSHPNIDYTLLKDYITNTCTIEFCPNSINKPHNY